MGNHRLKDMYDYQLPAYVDNRVYMHTEHIVQVGNAQLAEPVVTSEDKGRAAKKLASDFGTYLLGYAKNHNWLQINRIITRNVLLEFIGIKKIWWNPMMGPISRKTGKPLGNVQVGVINPANFIVDKNALPYENPAFTAEIIREPMETVFEKFPDKKNELLEKLGIRGARSQMSKVIGYYEVCFSYFEGNVPREGIVWFSEDFNIVLGKNKSHDWDYIGELRPDNTTVYKNMLDMPGKPHAYLTVNNLGRQFIDETSPIEQFLPLQDILNERGQQIKDNANEVRGGKVFNSRMTNRGDVEKFNNDPGASILVKGNVTEAYANVIPPLMPNYVMEDKYDARSEGDNIVGVHGPTRGERQGTDQPTTIQLLKEGDFQRRSDLITGIERMDEYAYKYSAHLMKLNYTEEHYEAIMGDDGKHTFIMMKSSSIPSSAISVRAGTTLPTDKISQRGEAMELMQLGKIDYITFFDRLGFPNPQEQAYKLYKHETAPNELYEASDSLEDAENDIEMLKNGESPAIPDNLDEAYMNELIKFTKAESFSNLPEELQQIASGYIQTVVEAAKMQLENAQPQAPVVPPEAGSKEATGPLGAVGGAIKQGIKTLTGK